MSKVNNVSKHLKELSVLYVEDEPFVREELEFFLQRRVSTLYVAKDGQEGLELYKKHKPDLVITDVQMPRLDGISMSKEIKDIDSNANIIIITAFNDTDYLFDAIKLNISNYLTKPLDLKILVDTLASISKTIFLEKENKEIYNTLKQYKDIVDERSIISKTDLNGNITYINEPFEKISGYKKEELLGKSHNIISNSLMNKDVFKNMWTRIKDEKKSWQGRIKNSSKNGDVYYVDMIIKPILDLEGNVLEFISLSNDITDLESTKEYFKNQSQLSSVDLKESIRQANAYKEAIDESNIILRLDLDKNITYVNKAFCDISGYSQNELIGKPYSIIKHPSLNRKKYKEIVKRIFAGDIWKGKISNISKDGSSFHCNVTVFPLKDKDDNIVEFMGIRHDITELENIHIELEETQKEVISKLGEVGEIRSQETGNHVKRVAEYSRLLGQKVGLSVYDTDILFTASPMHDIGKIGIPDNILNKNDRLTSDEWEVMKTHSQIGYNILKSSSRPILKAAGIVSYTHHEKWDGSGYPLGLKGDEIHIYGRITAIADVFDALGSDRVYKKSWPLENIIEFFQKEKAKHFDPSLIDLFMDNIEEFLEIRDKYKD